MVFCGTAAGRQSAQTQAYYAGSGNRFWGILHETGLTPQALDSHHYRGLLGYRIGLTDVCKTYAGMDMEIPARAFDPAELAKKIYELQPCAVAFNGKNAARAALGLKASEPVHYGFLDGAFGGAAVWVLPSTSGAANKTWDAAPWHALAAWLPDL